MLQVRQLANSNFDWISVLSLQIVFFAAGLWLTSQSPKANENLFVHNLGPGKISKLADYVDKML